MPPRASSSWACASSATSTAADPRIVSDGVNSLRDPGRAIVVITHYQRLLDYIVPDFVHVLLDGRIVRRGGKELALELERSGYGAFGPAEKAVA